MRYLGVSLASFLLATLLHSTQATWEEDSSITQEGLAKNTKFVDEVSSKTPACKDKTGNFAGTLRGTIKEGVTRVTGVNCGDEKSPTQVYVSYTMEKDEKVEKVKAFKTVDFWGDLDVEERSKLDEVAGVRWVVVDTSQEWEAAFVKNAKLSGNKNVSAANCYDKDKKFVGKIVKTINEEGTSVYITKVTCGEGEKESSIYPRYDGTTDSSQIGKVKSFTVATSEDQLRTQVNAKFNGASSIIASFLILLLTFVAKLTL